jgi:glycosyltransferase 2 family protein
VTSERASPPAGTTPPTTPPLWRRLARGAWLVLVVIALAAVLSQRWDEVRQTIDDLTVLGVVTAGIAVLAGVACSWMLWRSFLTGIAAPLQARHSARIFFVGQLSKYVPGSVWSLLALMEYGRDHEIPPRLSFGALALFMGTHLASGVLVAAVILPVAGTVPAWWGVAAIPAIALLVPGLQGRILSLTLRVVRRQPLPALPGWATMLRANAWSLVMWAVWGAHMWVLVEAAGADISPVTATGVFAAAWVAGFLVLPAPAGAGIREAVFVFLLPGLSTGAALTIALVSRALFTLADVTWGIVGLVWGRKGTVRQTIEEVKHAAEEPRSGSAVDAHDEVGEQPQAEQDQPRDQ